jgi:protein-S-isoprenylcysteine O-methyltransferase Ste14
MISEYIFNIIVISWIGIAVLLFPVLLKITAPYGRHSSKKWGMLINNRLGWFVMELPALLVFAFFVIKGGRLGDAVILAAFVLWMSHYVNRSLLYPFRINTKNKKIPLAIVLQGFFFNIVNGFINGYWLGILSPAYPEDWVHGPRFIIGVVLFILGFFINKYHDHLLIKLRKDNGPTYQIPKGGLFRYVSCPNFFGEIIEWSGFALLTWCLPSLSFFVWTFVNLVPRAIDHHRWYKRQFKDYPKNRKAVFPFLY